MSWIKTISPQAAEGRLAKSYQRIVGPDGKVDNILKAHSLRPHTLDGHMALYKNALHHSGNTLSKVVLEALGVYVSVLNGCDYCVDHHAAGLVRLLDDEAEGQAMVAALKQAQPERAFPDQAALFDYANKLTSDPRSVSAADIASLRACGLDDGQILEANQVIAYFAYANRTVLGLGVSTEGDVLGLNPSGGDGDWSHG